MRRPRVLVRRLLLPVVARVRRDTELRVVRRPAVLLRRVLRRAEPLREAEVVLLLRAVVRVFFLAAELKVTMLKPLQIQAAAPNLQLVHFFWQVLSSVQMRLASFFRKFFSPTVLATLNRRMQRLKKACLRLMSAWKLALVKFALFVAILSFPQMEK